MLSRILQLSSKDDIFQFGTISASCLCLAYAFLIVYRLWLHPLARFPGPRLAAATQWYEAYFELLHNNGTSYTPKIRQLHAQYGPIVRIGPNEISINDAEFHDKLYSPQPTIRDRHPHFSASLGTTKGSFSSVDHSTHRNRRMAYTAFYSSSNVTATEPLMRTQISTLCDFVESDKGQTPTSNLRTLFAALSFGTFYTWAFGTSLNLFENLQLAAYFNETVDLMVTGRAVLVVRLFPLVMAWARSIPHWFLSAVSQRMAHVFDLHKIIAKTAQEFVFNHKHLDETYDELSPISRPLSQPETLFSVIRRSKAPKEEKEASRMAQEGVEMFMAAFTPGRTLMTAMYYVYSQPAVLKALREELDMVNPDWRAISSMQTLNSLPYLRAVMKELLRISFPVGSRLPMIAHEDLVYKDWVIPTGTPISVNHRSLLCDPTIFPEPDEFRPDRWLESESPINEKRYFVPFGKGARGCPGKEFATQLIQICLATLVQRYDFEVVDTVWERDVQVQRESLLTAPSLGSKGINVRFVGLRQPLA